MGGRAWPWLISLIAFVLFLWGVAELLGIGGGGPRFATSTTIAAEVLPTGAGERATELHHLLPDATDDLGRLVFIDGTVVGDTSPAGFWVRDLRDNIIFVDGEATTRLETGDAVRIVGHIALLSPEEQADRLERAGLVVPTSAIVIRDVKVELAAGGVEVLEG